MISMSRWGCMGKPWPPFTQSSLITRRERNPMKVRVVIRVKRKCVMGIEPAESRLHRVRYCVGS